MDVNFSRIIKPNGPIQLHEFNEIIAQRSDLRPIPDRQAINPFTKESMTVPGAGKAYYLEQDKPVGNLSLEEGEVLTTGIPRSICDEIAVQLAADVHDDDRT